jgi:hypothetical protein
MSEVEHNASEMPDPAADVAFRNLIAALNRLRDDIDRVEVWTAALTLFQNPALTYRPDDQYVLPQRMRRLGD